MAWEPRDIRYHHLMTGGPARPLSPKVPSPRSGFVLVGGRSSRMGRDKATLPLAGGTLAGSIAARVAESASSVTLVGRPELYGNLGYRVIPDLIPNAGPLGAVYTALMDSASDWNLIVACDMPDVTVALFEDLFAAAERSGADCVAPGRADALHPLCAVYHRRCAPQAARAIQHNSLKMHDFVSDLQTMIWPLKNWAPLSNINTLEEWSAR
jgi:molybdopterin-guanine dinucleotide biosynthesis protein A